MKLKEHLEQLLQDEEFAAAYEDLEPFFQIAEDVIRLRLERGWSQEELARRVGTRQANISRLENGLSNPTVKFLQRVAKAFGVKLEIRLGKEQPREAMTTRSEAWDRAEPVPVWRVSHYLVGRIIRPSTDWEIKPSTQQIQAGETFDWTDIQQVA